jgi:hypothetical protein
VLGMQKNKPEFPKIKIDLCTSCLPLLRRRFAGLPGHGVYLSRRRVRAGDRRQGSGSFPQRAAFWNRPSCQKDRLHGLKGLRNKESLSSRNARPTASERTVIASYGTFCRSAVILISNPHRDDWSRTGDFTQDPVNEVAAGTTIADRPRVYRFLGGRSWTVAPQNEPWADGLRRKPPASAPRCCGSVQHP